MLENENIIFIEQLNDVMQKEGELCDCIANESYFDIDKFNTYNQLIFKLSNLNLEIEQRYCIVIRIWEINYIIKGLILRHCNEKDYFKISNLKDNIIARISEVLYYTANWYSYKREMNEKHLSIEKGS